MLNCLFIVRFFLMFADWCIGDFVVFIPVMADFVGFL